MQKLSYFWQFVRDWLAEIGSAHCVHTFEQRDGKTRRK